MNRVVDFLQKAKIFYVATVEDNQPRVRPFGAIVVYEGKLYLNTNNTKKVYQQIQRNPKIEICAFERGSWVRIQAEAIQDDREVVREAMLEANPGLKHMYQANDGKFEVLSLERAEATFYAMGKEPEVIRF